MIHYFYIYSRNPTSIKQTYIKLEHFVVSPTCHSLEYRYLLSKTQSLYCLSFRRDPEDGFDNSVMPHARPALRFDGPSGKNGYIWDWTAFEVTHIFPLAYEGSWRDLGYSGWITIPLDTESGRSINSLKNGQCSPQASPAVALKNLGQSGRNHKSLQISRPSPQMPRRNPANAQVKPTNAQAKPVNAQVKHADIQVKLGQRSESAWPFVSPSMVSSQNHT